MYITMLAFERDAAADDAKVAAWISRIPGVHMAIAGALRRVAGKEPVRPRGAIVAVNDRAVAAGLARATASEAGIDPASLLVETIDATIEIPLEPRQSGQRVFALVASFDYAPGPGDAIAAERHYLDYHVPHSRQLPGLRGYVTGRVLAELSTFEPRARVGIEMFESRDALAVSFRSKVGEEMIRDGQFVCADVRVHHLDGEVIV